MESIWNKTAEKPHFDSLKGDKYKKVLIIGGGIAGILCAYELQRAGVPYILLEAKSICSGATENITFANCNITSLALTKCKEITVKSATIDAWGMMSFNAKIENATIQKLQNQKGKVKINNSTIYSKE